VNASALGTSREGNVTSYVSDAGKEAMGFRRMPEGHELVARFHSLHVFTVQGFSVDGSPPVRSSGSAHGVNYEIAVGSSVNELCRLLIDDDFADDEEAWSAEKKCTPPYLLLHVGPTAEYSCEEGFIKTEGAETWVYDGFPDARDELAALHGQILPAIETALSCASASKDRNARFVLVERTVFGISSTNETIRDIRLEMHAEGYASVRVSREWVESFLERTVDLAADVEPKVARQFQQGLRDTDPLKQFLFYFLAIEIETHREYTSIDHEERLKEFIAVPERIRSSGSKLLSSHPAGLRTLLDRFIWCAMCSWSNVSDADIGDFKDLKRVRDQIAHGSISTPPKNSGVTAKKMASKLLASRFGA
jgi:hypothetical protein